MSQAKSQELSRQLAAVMFTDMAGYTALMQRDESAALRSRARHRAALEGAVPRLGGELLQYFGDGSLSIFRSSVQAVEAAVAIQRELGGDPALRIGLHLGDIAYDEQGAYGDAINIAARLEALSVPGGILVSEKVFDDIRRHPELAAVPSGSVRLKNVRQSIRTFALSVDGVVTPTDPVPEATGVEEELPTELRDRLDGRTGQSFSSAPTGTVPGRVPLIGRTREVEQLRGLVDRAAEGHGGTAFFHGPRGVGKTRLASEVASYTQARGWTVLSGRAYSAERLLPFAPFADALLPILQGLSEETLSELAPGGGDALRALFPGLGGGPSDAGVGQVEPGEVQARLFWNFTGVLARLAAYRPVLLVLEDLDFADRSSLELFHFVARQCADKPIFLIGQYTGLDPKRKRELVDIEQSLLAGEAATTFELEPLTEDETAEFVRHGLDTGEEDIGHLSRTLHGWTQGNPFFLKGTLRGLVETGVLRREDGVWKGLDVETIELPHSVRDAVLAWIGHLSEEANDLAQLLALLGTQVSYEVLTHVSDTPESTLAAALDELLRRQILVETEVEWRLLYDFRHPLIRETLRSELPLVRRRALHGAVAESLEALYGDRAENHADELAYHFGHARPGAGGKAVKYLCAAGQNALVQHANREALAYLQEGYDRIDAAPSADAGDLREQVIAGLARARRRLGHVPASIALWRRVLAAADGRGDARTSSQTHREIALAHMAGGQLEEAIEEFKLALGRSLEVDDPALTVRIQLALGLCYHGIGRSEEAEEVVQAALEIAERAGHPGLIGRVHSALMRLHIWTGQLDRVRSHANVALELARKSGDLSVEFHSQWAMGAMEGLTGNTARMRERIEEAKRLADEIGSPFLQLETAGLFVELSYAMGEWDEGIRIGAPAIELARSLGQKMILPRLLVWVSLIHLGRHELDEADRLTREAWEVSGADGAHGGADNVTVHTVVPAHIGRAAYHLARHEWSEAIRIAEAGLAIADRMKYVVWAIHRILPIISEASIQCRDLERAHAAADRLTREAEAVGHRLAFAWAEASNAILTWIHSDARTGAVSMRTGVEALESIPMIFEAARLRRHMAGRLVEIGDREEAIAELTKAYHVFERLGATYELEETLGQFGEVGAEPPDADG